MKRVLSLCLTLLMMFTLLMPIASAITFSDLAPEHWAYDYITTLTDAGVINGYEDGTYRPSGTVTRGEFMKLVMSSCMPKFIDLSEVEPSFDHWAAPYVKLAEIYDVIKINEINSENINGQITRMEMVRIISMADIIMKGNSQQFDKETNFIDVGALSLDDLYLLRHSVARGLIAGYEDSTFKGGQTMTRAEAATMIYRFTR